MLLSRHIEMFVRTQTALQKLVVLGSLDRKKYCPETISMKRNKATKWNGMLKAIKQCINNICKYLVKLV